MRPLPLGGSVAGAPAGWFRREGRARSITAIAVMGDYRNELQSALAQLEALRAENAALRAKVHPSPTPLLPREAPEAPRPSSPTLRSSAATVQKVLTSFALSTTLITLSSFAHRLREPPDPPLRMPDVPPIPAPRAAPSPLPMPPTTIRLPEGTHPPHPAIDVVEERTPTIQPVRLQPTEGPFASVRWQGATRGLYVLTTLPDAECTVGGARFSTPRPIFLEPGVYTVRCEAGHARHLWSVRIAAQRVTFDLEHRIGR